MASSTSWVTRRTPGWWRCAQLGHQALHAEAGEGVERGERLVEQQELGLADEGPCQRHPLRFAAREGAGPGIGLVFETHLAQRRRWLSRRVASLRGRPMTTLRQTRMETTRRGSW